MATPEHLISAVRFHNALTHIVVPHEGLYLVGPGDFNLEKALPPGSKMAQCEYSATGHMMMPIDSYSAPDQEEQGGLVIEQEVALPTSAKQHS